MKILHLMAGLSNASGVANIARRFARVQREGEGVKGEGVKGEGVKGAGRNEVVLLAPSFKWNPIYFGLVFAIRAWWNARTADEIWVHCSWTFPVWFGAWLARRRWRKEVEVDSGGHHLKLVVVPEGSFDPKRMNNHAGWKKRLVAPLDRWVLRVADEVLALCPDEVEWVKAFEPHARVRVERVPLFHRCARHTYGIVQSECACEGTRTTDRALHVLFLGRAEDPLKGVRFLERAVEEVNVGAGSGRPGSKVGLQSLGRPEPAPTVELRVVSDHFGEELERDWAWCDVLCLPTLSENFGLVVAEALERGKRVITTDGAPVWEPEAHSTGLPGTPVESLLTYLRGFREGTDEMRVKLLEDAMRMLLS